MGVPVSVTFIPRTNPSVPAGTVLVLSQQAPVGYDDTPMQPNGKWRIHDGKRPQPAIVTPPPGNTAQLAAPSDATLLIGDRDDLSAWGKNAALLSPCHNQSSRLRAVFCGTWRECLFPMLALVVNCCR